MKQYARLYCITCNKSDSLSYEDGANDLLWMIVHKDAIIDLAPFYSGPITLSWYVADIRGVAGFLMAHQKHQIEVGIERCE